MSDKKKNKARRSSILKPPKPRNALADVDLNSPVENTFIKLKRVSFTHKKIREFSADPEKNTIWHNFYEEEINKSDKSDLSKTENVDHIYNVESNVILSSNEMSIDSDDFNCTKIGNFDTSLEVALCSNSLDTSIASENIELTSNNFNCQLPSSNFKSIYFNPSIQNESMEITPTIFPEIPIIEERIQNTKKIKNQTIIFGKNNEESGNMETRQAEFFISKQGFNKEELVQTAHQTFEKDKRKTIIFNENMEEDGNMDITQAITAGCSATSQKIRKEEFHENVSQKIEKNKRKTIIFKENSEDGIMEITEAVPPECLVLKQIFRTESSQNRHTKVDKTKRQTIIFNQNTEEDGNMEITQAIPTECLEIKQSVRRDELLQNADQISQKSKRKTIIFTQNIGEDGNMDITKAVSPEILVTRQEINKDFSQSVYQKTEKSKRKTIIFNPNTEDGSMEITEAILPETLIRKDGIRREELQQNIEKTGRRTIIFYQNTKEDGNMEITQAFPAGSLTTKQEIRREELLQKEKQKTEETKRRTIIFKQNIGDDGNMEITEAVPEFLISRQEFVVEKLPQYTDKKIKKCNTNIYNQNIGEDGNMKLVEVVPSEILIKQGRRENLSEHIEKNKRKSICFNKTIEEDGNMEITKAVSSKIHLKQIIRKEDLFQDIEKKQKSIISSKNVEENESMEITETISPKIFVKQGIQTEELAQNIEEDKRKTIIFNQDIEEGGTMEITQAVPFVLKQEGLEQNLNHQIENFEQVSKKNGNININKTYLGHSNQLFENGNLFKTENANIDNIHSGTIRDKYLENNEADKENQSLSHINKKITQKNIKTTCELNTKDSNNLLSNDKENYNKLQSELIHSENKKVSDRTIELTSCLTSNLSQSFFASQNILKSCPLFQNKQKSTQINKITQDVVNNFLPYIDTENDNCTKIVEACFPENAERKETETFVKTSEIRTNFFQTNEKRNEMKAIDSCVSTAAENPDSNLQLSSQTLIETNKNNEESQLKRQDAIDLSFSEKISENSLFLNEPVIPNKILHLKGQSIILGPDYENTDNDNDICQRIKLPGQKDDSHVSKINLSEKLDYTHVEKQTSFNLSKNLSSFVDSTEKLINCKIESPISEYSKIIADDVINSLISNTNDILDEKTTEIVDTELNALLLEIGEEINFYDPEKDNEDIFSLKSFIEKSLIPAENLSSENISLINFSVNENDENYLVTKSKESSKFNLSNLKPLTSVNKIIETYFPLKKVTFPTFELHVQDRKIKKKNVDELRQRFFMHFENLEDKQEVEDLTLEKKIKQMICKDTLWNIVHSDNDEFSFTFMNQTIDFVVNIDATTEIVTNVEFNFHNSKLTSRPIWVYIHGILKKKLSPNHIKSACGQSYNIFSLLDYITITGEQMMDIYEEFLFLQTIGMSVDTSLNASFIYTNIYLSLAFKVTVNLYNLDKMTEECVTVEHLMGKVEENAVKRFIRNCPEGFKFLRNYHHTIRDYLDFLQRNRQARLGK